MRCNRHTILTIHPVITVRRRNSVTCFRFCRTTWRIQGYRKRRDAGTSPQSDEVVRRCSASAHISYFCPQTILRKKVSPTTKLLATPFSTSIKFTALRGSAVCALVSTIRTSKGAVVIFSSWKALTTVWLPGRNRWIETTPGRSSISSTQPSTA